MYKNVPIVYVVVLCFPIWEMYFFFLSLSSIYPSAYKAKYLLWTMLTITSGPPKNVKDDGCPYTVVFIFYIWAKT